jgi:hypothetical protein
VKKEEVRNVQGASLYATYLLWETARIVQIKEILEREINRLTINLNKVKEFLHSCQVLF